MKTPHTLARFVRHCLFTVFIAGVCSIARAQTPATGTIEGRVVNPATGEYLELAHITVEGTLLETLSDASGAYRLTNVPAGVVKVRAFRTGIAAQTQTVSVTAVETVQLDFALGDHRAAPPGDQAVKLAEFVVATSREMDGAAVAINTQRFAPNVMNVVSADEYAAMTEGGVGELLKAVPGMTVGIGGGGEPYLLSMNGVPPSNVPVSIGGFSLANATAGTSRQVGIEQISMNNVSRIEVAFTPTPETTGSALAGTVNLVPRSAFERTKPLYNFAGYLALRDNDRHLRQTPGPVREPTPKVRPGIDFSAIVPVNRRFGFTLSASRSSVYTDGDLTNQSWRGVGLPTNGGTLPDTTPDKPYLTDFTVGDQPKLTKRDSIGATLDFKPTRNDRISLSFMRGFIDFYSNNRSLNFFVNRVAPGDFTPTSTHGFAGAGEIRLTNAIGIFGGVVYMPTITYAHDGPVWKTELGAGHSHSTRHNLNINNGSFANAQARRLGVTVSFDDIYYLRPRVITVTDGATGARIDPYSISNYSLNTATGNALNAADLQRSAYANVKRDFFGRVPLTLKAGLDVRQVQRDTRTDNQTLTFVGADGRAGTADDAAAVVLDESFSQRIAPYGFPRIDWVSNQRLWDLWQAKPGYFSANEATHYTQSVAASKHADEVISSAYLRGDTQWFNGRLKLVGGLRAEQTNVRGEGQLVDLTRNYQRDASGKVILGTNGRPLPVTADALAAAKLTNIDRGLHSEKEYLRLFPSVNASYNVRENLIARAGYYWSVGRPDYVQYAGSLTLPDTENLPGPNNQITVNNAGIKAWTARTTKVSLEYYFERVGLFSVSAFQRNFKNFFGATVFHPTPEFLALYGLDAATYGDYDVSTQHNLSTPVRMTGVDFNYKQALTFLPNWARGVQVYANASALRATGDDSNSFQGYVPRTSSWGISLSRPKYNLQVKWNYNSPRRLGPIAAGRGIESGTYNWGAKRMLTDVIGEYYFYKRVAVFANLNNVGDAPADLKISGPSTPDYAKFRQRQNYGSLWTIGLRGTF